MACGKPVVASKVGGILEIIKDGKNGILVDPDSPAALADALFTILTDRELAMTLANHGQATVHERFTVERTGAGYEKLFADLVGHRTGEPASSPAPQAEC
jgi:glycosyltransferase involved in cell wall biosynthesis